MKNLRLAKQIFYPLLYKMLSIFLVFSLVG